MPIPLTCPHCRRSLETLDEHAGRQVRCPGCGGVVEVPVFLPPGAAPAGPASAPSAVVVPPGPAWTGVVFHPREFFAARTGPGGLGRAFLFGTICLALGDLGPWGWQWLSGTDLVTQLQEVNDQLGQLYPQLGLPAPPRLPDSLLGTLRTATRPWVVVPVILVLAPLHLLTWAVLFHIGVWMAGGRGFENSLRISGYAWAAEVLHVLPFGVFCCCFWGVFKILIWLVAIRAMYYGALSLHRLSPSRALLAASFPLLAAGLLGVGCGCCIAVLFAPLVARAG
ncbi:MAG: hypothetical protein HYY93_12785 [Planctomycetes bacterium]|nr:hypothetical protein [Planctomycetota bacterium]